MSLAIPSAPAVRSTPGLGLAFVVAAVVMGLSTRLPGAVSPLLVAIVVGAVCANLSLVPRRARPGLAVVGRRVLRLGIVLLGLQLMVGDVLSLGPGVLAGTVLIVVSGITASMLTGRVLRISPTQALLIGCGFSICGAAAVAAADGIVEEHEEAETVTAVALVVLFGTGMIVLVPALAAACGLTPHQAGVLAGGSIHEVAQVVAAGGVLSGDGGGALTTAVLVKLTRVLLLAPVLFALSVVRRRRTGDPSATTDRRPPLVPLFVAGFCVMVAVRSTGLVPAAVVAQAKVVQTFLLTAAMFALGCSVRLATLRRAGGGPFLVGMVATVVVTTVSLGIAVLV